MGWGGGQGSHLLWEEEGAGARAQSLMAIDFAKFYSNETSEETQKDQPESWGWWMWRGGDGGPRGGEEPPGRPRALPRAALPLLVLSSVLYDNSVLETCLSPGSHSGESIKPEEGAAGTCGAAAQVITWACGWNLRHGGGQLWD